MSPPGLAALLRRHGLRIQRARCVSTLDVEVWRLWPAGRAADGGRSMALRIYPPSKGAPEAALTELTWLAALADRGLRVPRPRADREGRWLQAMPAARSPGARRPGPADPPAPDRHAVLFDWVDGRCLDAGLKPVHLQRTGKLIAQLHETADALQRAGALPGPRRPADGPDLAAWAADERRPRPGWPRGAQAVAVRAAQALLEVQAGWPRDARHGLLHGDLHLWNLVHAADEAGAIDFTDCGWGWRLQDLAATLQYLRHPLAGHHDHRAAYPALRDALFEGYAQQRALPARWPAQLAALDALRWLNATEWVLDCWPDLDHRPFGRRLLRDVPRLLRGWLDTLG